MAWCQTPPSCCGPGSFLVYPQASLDPLWEASRQSWAAAKSIFRFQAHEEGAHVFEAFPPALVTGLGPVLIKDDRHFPRSS